MNLFGSFTSQTLNVNTGGGDDTVIFAPAYMAVVDATTIDTNGGDDTIIVEDLPDMLAYPITATAAAITDVIDLDGGDGADVYDIHATDNFNYVINIDETGTLGPGSIR